MTQSARGQNTSAAARPWPFGSLPSLAFGALLVDPPWHYEMRSAKGETKSPQAHYATLSDDDILALPVGDLASKQALIMLWAVWPKLALAHACLARWGFKYVTGGAWLKMARNGNLRLGTGYNFRSACEPFLLGRMGGPQARLTDVPNVIIAEAREHSRKPDEMRVIVERMTPDARRVELFARAPWPGNAVWGNEVDKFHAT